MLIFFDRPLGLPSNSILMTLFTSRSPTPAGNLTSIFRLEVGNDGGRYSRCVTGAKFVSAGIDTAPAFGLSFPQLRNSTITAMTTVLARMMAI
jgi:hypothetical protein